MENYGPDRRKYPRFNLKLKQRNFDFSAGREVEGHTCDVSNRGLGFVSDRSLPGNPEIDIWLYFSDNSVAVHTNGKVAWMTQTAQGEYRMGVNLTGEEIKPIPLVLKSIELRTRYYT